MIRLGKAYIFGQGDIAEGITWIRLPAKTGNITAMKELFILSKDPRVKSTVTDDEGSAALQKAADAGDAESMCDVAYWLHHTRGDYPGEMQWLEKAAGLGYPRAMATLGGKYKDGVGVQKNANEAAQWYRMAADKGDPGSMFRVGCLYYKGEGVPQDFGEALKWYRKASDHSWEASGRPW